MNIHDLFTLVSRNGTDRAGLRRIGLWRGIVASVMLFADVSAIVATSLVTGVAYHLAVYGSVGEIGDFVVLALMAAVIFTGNAMIQGEYSAMRVVAQPTRPTRIYHYWNLTCIALLVLGFVTKNIDAYSRGAILSFYVAGFPALFVVRKIVALLSESAARAGLLAVQRIFLFGYGADVRSFIEHYEDRPGGSVIVGCRFVTPVAPETSAAQQRASLMIDLDAAIESARALRPDAVMLMMPWSDTALVDACVKRLMALPAEIHLGPDRILHEYKDAQLTRFGEISSLRLTRTPLSTFEIAMKRVLDLILASVGLFVATPLLILVALAIKLDSPGPVFFLQQRFGFNQRPFRIIKFRTMRTLDDGAVVRQTTRADARVTRVGGMLRRSNIDEIPQLFNVIMGDMSLVGPRPHALTHDREYGEKIAVYARRHNVKPGITGWAQVNGFRGETDTDEKMERRVAHDIWYIENWSLALDLRILALTVLSRKAYRNAY